MPTMPTALASFPPFLAREAPSLGPCIFCSLTRHSESAVYFFISFLASYLITVLVIFLFHCMENIFHIGHISTGFSFSFFFLVIFFYPRKKTTVLPSLRARFNGIENYTFWGVAYWPPGFIWREGEFLFFGFVITGFFGVCFSLIIFVVIIWV